MKNLSNILEKQWGTVGKLSIFVGFFSYFILISVWKLDTPFQHIPLIITVLLFIVGIGSIAHSQKRSYWLGLLGLFTLYNFFIGVFIAVIISALPNKNKNESENIKSNESLTLKQKQDQEGSNKKQIKASLLYFTFFIIIHALLITLSTSTAIVSGIFYILVIYTILAIGVFLTIKSFIKKEHVNSILLFILTLLTLISFSFLMHAKIAIKLFENKDSYRYQSVYGDLDKWQHEAVLKIENELKPKTKEEEIYNLLEYANICQKKEDCVRAAPFCPFRCNVFVNKNDVDKVNNLIKSYDNQCESECTFIEYDVDCINESCSPISPTL